jgi:hypothetical protein
MDRLDIELVDRPGRVHEPVETVDKLPHIVYGADKNLLGPSNLIVLHDCRDDLLADDLGEKIDEMFFKFSKRFDRGQLLGLGWSCGQGNKVKKINKCIVPYMLKASRTEVGAKFEKLHLRSALKFMWTALERYFPDEAKRANALPDQYHYLGTGFNKAICAVNNSTPLHFDNLNMDGTACAILVLGKFEGGDQLVVDRNTVHVLQNKHHTLFIGDYGRFLHASLPVTGGKRTIIAAFTMQQVQKVRPMTYLSADFQFTPLMLSPLINSTSSVCCTSTLTATMTTMTTKAVVQVPWH